MNQTKQTNTFARKLIAACLALLLCVSWVPTQAGARGEDDAAQTGSAPAVQAASAHAQAAAPQADEVEKSQVTLTIVAGTQTDWTTNETTYTTWVNKYYTLDDVLAAARANGRDDRTADTLTMLDLLDAAVAAGDIKSYDAAPSSYGGHYLNSITSRDGLKLEGINSPDYALSEFWSVLADGAQTPTAFDLVKLEEGHAYQFAWDTYTTASAPATWSQFYIENPAEALPAGADTSQGEVTLTITAGSETDYATGKVTYPAWVNKRYALSEVLAVATAKDATKTLATLTMEDLLNAAQAAGDIKTYDATPSSYGGLSLNAITSKADVTLTGWNSEDYSASLYWSTYDNGGYANSSFSQVLLQDQNTYQFAWDSYSTAHAPSNWTDFYTANAPAAADDKNDAGEGEDPIIPPAPPAETFKPTTIDDAVVDTLIENIAATYANTQEAWPIMDMAALDRANAVDAQAFIAGAAQAMKAPAADGAMTAYQRTILALSALGQDATRVPDGEGTFNAITEMANRVSASSPVTVLAFTLLAYASGDYEVPAGALLDTDALIAALISHQGADGGFSYSGSAADADVTSMVIAALAPYKTESAQAAAALDKALVALHALQHDDGGFGATGFGVDPETNANSTAMAVIALCAAGIDPATSWVTASGATPLSALLTQATAGQDAFVYAGQPNAGATEQGFRALVAYRGFKNTGDAYNIYTQARFGQAKVPEAGTIVNPGDSVPPTDVVQVAPTDQANKDGEGTVGTAGVTTSPSTLPPTGDSMPGQVCGALMLCALAALAVAASRRGMARGVRAQSKMN